MPPARRSPPAGSAPRVSLRDLPLHVVQAHVLNHLVNSRNLASLALAYKRNNPAVEELRRSKAASPSVELSKLAAAIGKVVRQPAEPGAKRILKTLEPQFRVQLRNDDPITRRYIVSGQHYVALVVTVRSGQQVSTRNEERIVARIGPAVGGLGARGTVWIRKKSSASPGLLVTSEGNARVDAVKRALGFRRSTRVRRRVNYRV